MKKFVSISLFSLLVFSVFIIALSILEQTPAHAATLSTINSSFFDRGDILYGSEIGSWKMQDNRYDGHYMINYNNSCPACVQLALDAKIPVVRWAVSDTFTDQKNPARQYGSIPRTQFDSVINGIRNTLEAYPFIKLQPISPISTNDFCPESWGTPNLLEFDKSIIKQAGNKVQLYEIANEMEHDCGYSLAETGTKAGQYWVQVAPKLKKYARSLGFEIYIGGAAFQTANINAGTDSADAKKFQDFLQVIKTEYDNPSSPYYHDADLIPSFVSFHVYGIEYVNIVGGSSTPLDGITHYGDLIDSIQTNIDFIWGSLGSSIKMVCSEWNVGAETYAFPDPLSANFYTQFLQMLRSHGVVMANQFLMASNNNKMDMITQSGSSTPYYDAFKTESLTDTDAVNTRNGITPTPTSTPTPTPTPLPYSTVVTNDTPVAYWRLGESSGTNAANNLSSNYTGTYTNSPLLGQSGAIIGDSDTAVQFDGSSSYVDVPYNVALNPSSFSVEVWVYPTGGAGTYRGIAASRVYPNGWVLYADGNDNYSFWVNDGATMTAVIGDTVTLNQWTQLVATFDGSTARLYVNKTQATPQSIVAYTANGTNDFIIGQGEIGTSFFFPGKIDEVSLYNTTLSSANITTHYNAARPTLTPTPTTYPQPKVSYATNVANDTPIAYWRLGESSGTDAVNNISSNYTGTYVNSPLLGQTGALNNDANTSVTFDGTSSYTTVSYNSALNSSQFSIEAWVYPTGGSGYRGIVSNRSYPNGWVFYIDSNDDFAFWVNNDTAMASLIGPSVTLNTWSHLVGTFDGTNARFYVNGTLQSTQAITSYLANTSAALTIGQGDVGSNFFFQGTIDEVALYPSALSSSRIDAHYQSGINGGPGTPDTIAPTTPGALTASAFSSTNVDLSWVTSWDYNSVAKYYVYRDNQLIGTTTIPYYSDSGLTGSTAYTYYVTAEDGSGNTSTASNTFTVTTFEPGGSDSSTSSSNSSSSSCTQNGPSQPTISQAYAADNSVTLYVVPVSGTVSSYQIYYGPPEDKYQYAASINQGYDSGIIQFPIHGLSPNQKYLFQIRGMNQCAPGTMSSIFSLKTAAAQEKGFMYYATGAKRRSILPDTIALPERTEEIPSAQLTQVSQDHTSSSELSVKSGDRNDKGEKPFWEKIFTFIKKFFSLFFPS